MEIVEVKCKNCGREIFILPDKVKEEMFCTIGCMDKFESSNGHKGHNHHLITGNAS